MGLVGIAGYLGGVPGGLAAFIIWLVFDVKPFVRNKLEKRLQKNQETNDSGEMPGFGAQLSEGLFGGLDALLNPLDFLGHAWDNFAESFKTGEINDKRWVDHVKNTMVPIVNESLTPATDGAGVSMDTLGKMTKIETDNSVKLAEKLPIETAAHNDNADAVNAEAEAKRNLAAAERELAAARQELADSGAFGSASDNIE